MISRTIGPPEDKATLKIHIELYQVTFSRVCSVVLGKNQGILRVWRKDILVLSLTDSRFLQDLIVDVYLITAQSCYNLM